MLLKGQTPLAFEAASVRASAPDAPSLDRVPPDVADKMGLRGGPGTSDPGRLDWSRVTLKGLLMRAYGLRRDQVAGPGWLDRERYDIVAKLPPGTDEEKFRHMLQTLLSERFQIQSQRESRTLPVYRLTVARTGPRLKPAEKAVEYTAERMAAMRQAAMQAAAADASRRFLGRRLGLASGTVARFADLLSSRLDRPVIDATELKGVYSFRLEWAPEGAGRDDQSGPSIFTAIQEQLGLVLHAGTDQIEILVIDNAERVPIPN
jgi:uncharacterized protein (TIGR03435 family)